MDPEECFPSPHSSLVSSRKSTVPMDYKRAETKERDINPSIADTLPHSVSVLSFLLSLSIPSFSSGQSWFSPYFQDRHISCSYSNYYGGERRAGGLEKPLITGLAEEYSHPSPTGLRNREFSNTSVKTVQPSDQATKQGHNCSGVQLFFLTVSRFLQFPRIKKISRHWQHQLGEDVRLLQDMDPATNHSRHTPMLRPVFSIKHIKN